MNSVPRKKNYVKPEWKYDTPVDVAFREFLKQYKNAYERPMSEAAIDAFDMEGKFENNAKNLTYWKEAASECFQAYMTKITRKPIKL